MVILIEIYIFTRLTTYYLLGSIHKIMNEHNDGISSLYFALCFAPVFTEMFVYIYMREFLLHFAACYTIFLIYLLCLYVMARNLFKIAFYCGQFFG